MSPYVLALQSSTEYETCPFCHALVNIEPTSLRWNWETDFNLCHRWTYKSQMKMKLTLNLWHRWCEPSYYKCTQNHVLYFFVTCIHKRWAHIVKKLKKSTGDDRREISKRFFTVQVFARYVILLQYFMTSSRLVQP